MPDDLFAHPRLAQVYDTLDGDRSDLVHHRAIVDELGATSVLDVGCGTGTFACLLAQSGVDVVGIDPAEASLAIARRKPGADRVDWRLGQATELPPVDVDLVTMTGNVAQVFLTDDEWANVLTSCRTAMRPGGHLLFETRVPERRSWEEWTPELTRREVTAPGVGRIDHWTELTEVRLPLVSFRHHVRFHGDDVTLTSDSTLRFRTRSEIDESLAVAGFAIVDTRDAPDRLGREFVFIARADAP